MAMTERNESLPRPAHELEALAAYYDTHDTSSEMDQGEWVDPRPMKTTSLRLPEDVVEALKALALTRGMRYTSLVREIIEQALSGLRRAEADEFAQINERLARIEAAVLGSPAASERQSSTKKRSGPEATSRAVRKRAREQGAKAREATKFKPTATGKAKRNVS